MSDAIRNVTIVLNVQPGDMSAIQAAKKELEEMRGITDGIGASTAKITAETESLAKATSEVVKQDKEFLTLAKDRTTIEEQASQKRTEIRKRELEAETKLETQAVEQIERIRRPLRDNAPTIGTSKSVTGEEASKIAEANAKKNEEIEAQRREKEHQMEMDAIDRKNAEELKKHQEKMKKEEDAEEQARQATMQKKNQEMAKGIGELLKEIAKREEAEQKAQDKKEEAAEKTLQKIRVSELRNIREREVEQQQEEQDRINRAARVLQNVRTSELRNIRERQAEEERAEEETINRAARVLQNIRTSELRNIREREAEEEEQQQRRVTAATRTLNRIREAEVRHANEMREEAEEAMEEMPRHWRNIGLNAGQASASAARFIGHLKMLKNVGGESLEGLAKQFMTVQSRVETISASTSFFTNIGTMVEGLTTAGRATERVVRQQQILGEATTFTQRATIDLGNAAAGIAPLIAPIQFGFTAIVASVVALDVIMDLVGTSIEENKRKSEEYLNTYETGLDKVISKLDLQKQLTEGTTQALEEQWSIQKLLAGDEGLAPDEIVKRNQQLREQKDRESTKEILKGIPELFDAGISNEQKIESERIKAERAQAQADLKALNEGQFVGRTGGGVGGGAVNIQQEIWLREQKLQQLEKEEQILKEKIGDEGKKTIGTASFKDGVMTNFDDVNKALKSMPEDLQDEASKMLLLMEKQLVEGSQLNRNQFDEARKAAESSEMQRKSKERELEALTDEQRAEQGFANRFNLGPSKFALSDAEESLKNAERSGNIDDKQMEIERAKKSLEEAGLLTPALRKELELGASADIGAVRRGIGDASEYTAAEKRDDDNAIKEAQDAITKAEDERDAMRILVTTMTKLLDENQRQLTEVRRAIENRDLN